MATAQSSFIVRQYPGWGGNVVDSNYLGAAYNTGKPHVFENTLMRIYSSKNNLFTPKPLLGMTGAKMAGTVEIPTEIYQWYLQGAEEKSARSLQNLESGNAAPGLNNTTFRAKLDLDFYSYPDVLFGEDNEFPLAIQESYPDGQGTVYVLKIQGDNPSAFFPNYLLDAGREFNKVWTSVPSEFNQWGGTQQYPNSFKLESQVGAFAQELHITDKAWRDQGRMDVEFTYTDTNGNESKVTKFLAMAEGKMNDELYASMEAQLTYGKKSTTAGPDKFWTKTGQSGPLHIVIYVAYTL